MPNLHNVIDDIAQTMFPNGEVQFEVKNKGTYEKYDKWIVYMRVPNGVMRAKVELMIDEHINDPENTEVLGSVLRYGSVSRSTMARIMDTIMEFY